MKIQVDLDVVNRTMQFLTGLRDSIAPKRLSNRSATVAKSSSARVLELLKNRAPQGQVERSYRGGKRGAGYTIAHGRPSIRQGHGTLESHWGEPEVEKFDGGARLIFPNTAPQMHWLLEGTKRHDIPHGGGKRVTLSFWWGAPLRWNPVGPDGPGGHAYDSVKHPGIRKGPYTYFIDEAIEQGGADLIVSNLRKEGENTMKEIKKNLG